MSVCQVQYEDGHNGRIMRLEELSREFRLPTHIIRLVPFFILDEINRRTDELCISSIKCRFKAFVLLVPILFFFS